MTDTKSVITSLPLVADALGRKYGVKVHIGGERAYTDGRDIHIPAIPLDADSSILNLVRGYLDHEAAHLRSTDFEVVEKAHLTQLERHIWNIIEDYMVESKLAALYPGCGQNFKWLLQHLFLNENGESDPTENSGINDICNWLLLSLRSLTVPELEPQCRKLALGIDSNYPGLRSQLEPLVEAIPSDCTDTSACIGMAKRILAIIEEYADSHQEEQQKEETQDKQQEGASSAPNDEQTGNGMEASNSDKNKEDTKTEKQTPSETGEIHAASQEGGADEETDGDVSTSNTELEDQPHKTLREMLDDPSCVASKDIGDMAGEMLEAVNLNGSYQQLQVAVQQPVRSEALSPEDVSEIRQNTSALRTRLTAMLQAHILTRSHIGRSGRIDTKRMAKLSVADSRIFVKHGKKQGINTAVHILLDTSYSMKNEGKIRLACLACYAVAETLHKIPGIGVAVTNFPCGSVIDSKTHKFSDATVGSVLAHKSKFHNKFDVVCDGGTPMAQALWWVLQKMKPLPEERKILLILSDGVPDDSQEASQAIEAHQAQGHEVYGIGIRTEAMKRLMENKNSQAIYDLRDLAPAMFNLLRTSLLKRKGEGK